MFKRLFDIASSGLILLITTPLFAVISLLIKLESPGPVFYRQLRVGKGQRLFTIYKFRTMVDEADRIGPAVTTANDPRITRIGMILRRYELDELPTLLNVLKGEMSVVGPRPEVPKYLPYYTEEQKRVFSVRPGMTDLGTLKFRSEARLLEGSDDPEMVYIKQILPEKLRLNLDYLDRQSLFYDLSMICRTFALIFLQLKGRTRLERAAAERLQSYKRFMVSIVFHLFLTFASFLVAFLLRFDMRIPMPEWERFWKTVPFLMVVRGTIFYRYGLYWGIWRYTDIGDVLDILKSVSLGSVLFTSGSLIIFGHGFSRAVLLIDWVFCLMLITGVRFLAKVSQDASRKPRLGGGKPAIIVGAGDAGERLVREMDESPALGYRVVGFVDDDPAKQKCRIHGIQVLGKIDDLPEICQARKAQEIIVAIPSLTGREMRRIVELCERSGVPFKTVPTLRDLLSGKVPISQIRSIEPEDLLGGEPVRLDRDRMR